MSSILSANSTVSSDRTSTRRKKKKRTQQPQDLGENFNDNNRRRNSSVEWKSEAQHQIYSSKLIQALRQVRISGSGGSSGPKRVHEAADRVLATTAKGRTRWSRAILTNRLKLKFMKKNNIVKRESKVMTVITGSSSRLQRKSKVKIFRLQSKSLPAVQRKARHLGRLVPGCRKQPLPVVLEEATDYIAALEMQVRAMSAVAELLSAPGPSTVATSGGGHSHFTTGLNSRNS